MSLADLETVFGLATVTVGDLAVAGTLGVSTFPAVILIDAGNRAEFPGPFFHEDVAIEIRNWVATLIETREKTIIKSIEAEELKSRPEEFKNVRIVYKSLFHVNHLIALF